MMKQKALSLFLALLMLAGTASCSGGGTNEETEPQSTAVGAADPSVQDAAAAEDEPEGNGRSDVKDSLPDDLDFGGATLHFYTRGGDRDTLMEFQAEELNGEVVNDAVYARNLEGQERLNIAMDLILAPVNIHGGTNDQIRKSVSSGSNDYDLLGNGMYSMMSLTMENILLPMNELPYLDFSAPWYNHAFLETTNLNGHNYTVMGELGQTMISGSFVMFFNKTLFDTFYNGEINLYQIVNEGEWTIDKMTSLCEPVYQDANGNGEADEGDIFGHYFTNTDTLGADAFYGASRIEYLKKDESGTWFFNATCDRMVTFTEKMHKLLFEGTNTLRLPYNNDDIMNTMKADQTIFVTWMLSGIDLLRDMESDFGILPMPKLDTAQEKYAEYVHDASTSFSIPVTEQDPAMVAAFLEAMSAESFRTVTPAYFETALKAKYSRDSETSQMLDIIVDGIYLDLSYIFGGSVNAPIGKIRGILASDRNCENAVSSLAKQEKATMKSLEKLLQKYEDIK
jgi:ABC-type glycerol-3-phosphate transport system substrate-binding protein